MASQSRCRQRQPVALDAAYQKPAGGEVAFPMPLVVADELMVVKLRGKLLFWLERLEHILKHPHVTALLLRPLVVLLELICPDDVVVYVVHSFNTLNASSTLE